MRKFRFIGDPERYGWEVPPKYGQIFDGDFLWKSDALKPLQDWFFTEKNDWEEVFDQPNPLHKDTDLGHFAGLILSGMFNDNGFVDSENEMCKNAISYAEELIRQLDEKTKKIMKIYFKKKVLNLISI